MTDSGSSGGIWDIGFWSNASNLIGVFVLGGLLPFAKWILSSYEKKRNANRIKEDERITQICDKMMDPVIKKLDDIGNKVNYMDEVFKKKISFYEDEDDDSDIGGRNKSNRKPYGGGAGDGGPGSQQGSRPRNRHRYDAFANREYHDNNDLR